ncbi:MAG: transporter [Pirellulales bacterium]|nr:transporter [Pirellulales bacterium]
MGELVAAAPVAMGWLDALVVLVYLVGTTALGVVLGRGQTSNRDYFLGGHRLPTWALLVSIVATETSTVTFLSVPGKSFVAGGNFTFLQIAIGYIVGRFGVILFLLPGYFRGETLTAYHVLEQRFGRTTRRLASLVFLLTRNLADGLRLFLTAIALNIALGLPMVPCIVITTVATAIYSCAGGVRSVVWNDCIQFAVYMLGAIVAAGLLLSLIPGGWHELSTFGTATRRWQFFDFNPSLTTPGMTFWVGLIGGGFLSLASHGVDQLVVQRYLCARSRAAAGWALGLSGFIVFAQFALFLFIGVALACFDAATGGIGAVKHDQAFMTFVVGHMGTGLKGLILAAVLSAAMSTVASSLNSSASSLVSDWIAPYVATLEERKALRLSRWLTLGFATVQGCVALGAFEWWRRDTQALAIVDLVLIIAGFAIGLLLGLYALGLLIPRAGERVALLAFGVGVAVATSMLWTPLNPFWYTLVGSCTIVIVGAVLDAMHRKMKLPSSGDSI